MKKLQRDDLKKQPLHLLMTALALLFLHCSASNSLSDAEKGKLDSHMIRLFEGGPIEDTPGFETVRADGSKEYAVIVTSDHPEEIKAMGIAVSSVFGDVLVVHGTLHDLQKIVALPSVRAIRAGTRTAIPQHLSPGKNQ